MAGIAGAGIAGLGIKSPSVPVSSSNPENDILKKWHQLEKSHLQRFNMSGFATKPIDKVRIGIIGMGQRGPSHMITMSHVENTEIKAICDLRPEKANAAKKLLAGTKHDPVVYSGNSEEWKKLCERDDIDLVIGVSRFAFGVSGVLRCKVF